MEIRSGYYTEDPVWPPTTRDQVEKLRWAHSMKEWQERHSETYGVSREVARLREQLARYTYKPDWYWAILPPDGVGLMGQAVLRVETWVTDSRGSGRGIPIRSNQLVPYALSEDRFSQEFFVHWLQSAIRNVEEHERREWFRYDGKLIDDPHAQGARP